MNRHSFGIFFSLCFIASCGQPPPKVESGSLEQSVDPLWQVDDAHVQTRTWNSGEDTQLSSWQVVDCRGRYGDDMLISGVTGFKERSSNLDAFIARLQATCAKYETNPYPNGDYYKTSQTYSDLVFTSNYRTGGSTTRVTTDNYYAIGFDLRYNFDDGYLKDMQILYVQTLNRDYLESYATPLSGSWITDYSGTEQRLQCPDQTVMTGVGVRYSTNTGKVRQLKIYCRELIHT